MVEGEWKGFVVLNLAKKGTCVLWKRQGLWLGAVGLQQRLAQHFGCE